MTPDQYDFVWFFPPFQLQNHIAAFNLPEKSRLGLQAESERLAPSVQATKLIGIGI